MYTDSRYVSGEFYSTYDAHRNLTSVSVYRNFPKINRANAVYTWKDGDRIDLVAEALLGNPAMWWKIADVNPQLTNPMNIQVGTQIWIPRVS
jgi:hypothetical protein